MDTARVLTGRRSLKFVTASGSINEYVEFTLDDPIHLPQIVRIFIYFGTPPPDLEVRYYDTFGNEVPIDIVSVPATAQWFRFSEAFGQVTEVGNMEVDTGVPSTEDLIVNYSVSIEDNLEVRKEVQAGLLQINKVRITIKSDIVSTFYVDRLDTYANIYNFHELQLEEVEYSLSSVGLFANLNYGEKEDSIIDEIKKKIDENNIALQIFSKQ